jgi:ATP-dependent Clp protease ATP-binding subunit ClpA
MYERFTDRARKVMQLANQEARRLHHEYVGTEHILLGLVREGSGVAANVLKNLDIDLNTVRREVEKIVVSGPDAVTTGNLPQTPRAKKVVEYSTDEARNLKHNYVGTEHILLGLLREQEGVAAQVLTNLRLSLDFVRREVLRLLGGEESFPGSPGQHFPWVGVQELPAAEFPTGIREQLQELDTKIQTLRDEMETAIAEQDFERAAHLRDQADRLQKRRRVVIREWYEGHTLAPSWLTWNGGTVVKIARTICDDRCWEAFPALADALEAAGCTDRVLLDHCRQPGEHHHGCWVVDLLLDKA